MKTAALAGIRVLDASRILAGPLAAQILGEYGAEVLKIEPPTGDDTRQWGPPFQGPQSAYFQSCNRNKSSLVLDLEKASDRTRFNQLLAKADIYLDNFLPHSQSKWGVDEASLSRQFPSLVHGHIASFPAGHARAEEKGYDLALQAETGWIALNGAPQDPVGSKVGVAVLDVLSGQMLANALLAGLVKRLRTGQGGGISVSLVQTALYCLVNVASNALVSGKPSQRWGNAHANIVPYQDFACRDGCLVLAIGNDRQFQSFCGLMGLGKDPISQMNNPQRVENRDLVVRKIAKVLADQPMESLLGQLRAQGVPCAPLLSPLEALQRFSEGVVAIRHDALGEVKFPRFPVQSAGIAANTAPPLLGEGGAEMAYRWLSD